MSSQQSIFEVVIGSSFGTPAYDYGIHTEDTVNHFTELNGASATVYTV